MDILNEIVSYLKEYIPSTIGIIVVIFVLWLVRLILDKKYSETPGHRFRHQVITAVLMFTGLIFIILIAPLSDAQRGQLLSLFGILITAAIALSSATLVGNAVAGVMLRAVRNFKAGDFITVGEHFGRVSERGLFHIEIQNEERDLVTLPNVYVASNPVEVVRSSGTIISATVSLGYDIPRSLVKKLLIEAAEMAELSEPFVHVKELGDFSVIYRIAGLLEEPKHIISGRSRLRCRMLDALHENGVEIVSPTHMNTRAFPVTKQFIPLSHKVIGEEAESRPEVEEVAFDKADEAESQEKLEQMLQDVGKQIEDAEQDLKQTSDANAEIQFKKEIERLHQRKEQLSDVIKGRKDSD